MLRFKPAASGKTYEINNLIRLWLLRLLVPLGGHREFLNSHSFGNDSLAEILGLGDWVDNNKKEFNPQLLRSELRHMHREAERTLCHATPSKRLSKNIARISSLVGMTDTDCRILEFTVYVHCERLLDDTADCLGNLSSVSVHHVLAVLLDLPEKEIRTSLSPNGVLARSGLVTIDRDGTGVLRNKLNLLSDRFADSILDVDADPLTLLRDIVISSKAPHLALEDFGHISQTLTILLAYLRHALTIKKSGVNIFLYGPPGTGKSELARILARKMECELFEIASECNDGNPISSVERLRAFRAAQCFFAQNQTLLLFDEIEDIFGNGNIFEQTSAAPSRKAWINRILEENAVPTIWISNSVHGIDQAFIRRFDMVIEMPVPPKRQRERIIRKSCNEMLPAESIRRIAENNKIAPAIISRAVSVVNCIQTELEKQDISKAIEHLISNTIEAQGHQPLKLGDTDRLPDIYDPAFIHVETDLVSVADGLAQTKSGRLCLYGPPGTGKTAFGRWLADRLDMPLYMKRGSDLLSMWVGGTEQNIASAFQEAKQDGALLLIDEVDSFLQDRRHAQKSWEVTAVNEMLTQMESFPGVFVASTNLMGQLDQASLRRFDLKLKFDYLLPEQAWTLFERQCAALEIPVPAPSLKVTLARLSILTPGDFAAVVRQDRFRPIKTPAIFLSALEQECLVKENGHRNIIGF